MTYSNEEEYISFRSKYNIEKQIFSTMTKEDISIFILDKLVEHKVLSILVDSKLKLVKLIYNTLSELEDYYIDIHFNTFDSDWIKLKELENFLSIFDLEINKRKFVRNCKGGYKKNLDINYISIESIIWKYVRLSGSLSRNIRCPFSDHRDNSASFRIYKNTNSYYCYWCHRGGNILNFLADIENISTKEAYKLLLANL